MVQAGFRTTARRLLLLAAVFAGLLAMHVLGAEDVNGNHVMPGVASSETTMHTAVPLGADTWSQLVVVDAGSHPSSHDAMAACELFLVAGAVWSVFGWLLRKLIRRPPALVLPIAARVTAQRWRAPPAAAGRPRIALCVLRI